jgi:hypothetical protein
MKYDRFEYQGKVYGIGTKVLAKAMWSEPQEVVFVGWRDGYGFHGERYLSTRYADPEKIIIKILEPVEIKEDNEPKNSATFHKTHPQNTEEVFYGWIFYILVMIVGAIFIDRWLIWIGATLLFFSWRSQK